MTDTTSQLPGLLKVEVGKSYVNGLNDIVTITSKSELAMDFPFKSDKGYFNAAGACRALKPNSNTKRYLVREITLDEQFTAMHDHTIKLPFESFKVYQNGMGFVCFGLTEEEKRGGEYDPHVMFIHDNSEVNDPAVKGQVEEDCRELARLLNKFRIPKEWLSDRLLTSRITPQAHCSEPTAVRPTDTKTAPTPNPNDHCKDQGAY